jgi:hypothetical protein
MKKILFVLALGFFAFNMSAQTENDYLELTRNVLKVEKKAAVAEVMQLDESKSQDFWNLYNEYDMKLYQVQNKRIAIIKDYAKHYTTMTDEKADELLTASLKYQGEILKLKKAYYGKFKKVLPAAKAALFMQVDNKIETLVNAQLALEIPFVQTK